MNTLRLAIPCLLALALLTMACPSQQTPRLEDAELPPPLQPIVEPGEERLRDGTAPDLSISVNGTLELKVHQGTPLVLDGEVRHLFRAPRPWQGKPLRLQDKQGQWLPLVQLAIHDERRQAVTWPWTLEATPAGVLDLDHTKAGTLHGLLSPEDSAKIAPGKYTLTLILDSTQEGAPDTFRGRVEANPAFIEILPAATDLALEAELTRARDRAAYFLAKGQKDKALEVVSSLSARFPEQPETLGIHADALEQTGDLDGAYALFARALELHLQQEPGPQEEPVSYGLRLHQLRRKMAARR